MPCEQEVLVLCLLNELNAFASFVPRLYLLPPVWPKIYSNSDFGQETGWPKEPSFEHNDRLATAIP